MSYIGPKPCRIFKSNCCHLELQPGNLVVSAVTISSQRAGGGDTAVASLSFFQWHFQVILAEKSGEKEENNQNSH